MKILQNHDKKENKKLIIDIYIYSCIIFKLKKDMYINNRNIHYH